MEQECLQRAPSVQPAVKSTLYIVHGRELLLDLGINVSYLFLRVTVFEKYPEANLCCLIGFLDGVRLGCIEADLCKYTLSVQHFSRPTQFAYFRTA